MPAIDNAFNDDSRPLSRALTSIAHQLRATLIVIAVLQIPSYFGAGHWLLDTLTTVAMLSTLVATLHEHSTRMCVRCMAEVPADAPIRAQRNLLLLRMFHRPFLTLLAFIAAITITGYLIDSHGFPPLLAAPADAMWLAIMYSTWFHHRMRPWCPYCKDWGDGGMREPSPDPTIKATL